MTKVRITFENNLRSEGVMEGAKSVVIVDGPKAYGGLEEEMGPTDLFALSLGSCMLTMMGMKAGQLKVDLSGTHAEVEKHLVMKPHLTVGKLSVTITIPHTFPEEVQTKLEEVARHCPIHLALSAEVEQHVTFVWGG